jgi:branched-chain amino acid transport system permease protein
LGVLVAGVAAFVLAFPTAALVFRLRGGYFAIGTWVVAEVYRLVLSSQAKLGGGSGATVTVIGIDPTFRLFVTYWISLAIGVGSIVLVFYALRSRLGLGLRAVRDREGAAATSGVNVRRTKVQVYVIASTVCGLAGGVIYLALLRLQPAATFSINWTVFMIFAVVIGGLGTITGPIVGTLVYFALQQYLADLGSVYLIILGAVAIVVMLKAPNGLWGLVIDRWNVPFFPIQLRVRRTQRVRPRGLRPGGRRVSCGIPMDRFESPTDVRERLTRVHYLADDHVAMTVFLADRLSKPLLCEGPAGVGKTELAKALAESTGRSLLRLQCYEGLDEAKALYEWNYKKQLLRIQSDSGEQDWERVEQDIFSEEFLLPRPLLSAIRSSEPVVLLIDEVDRVEIETEALLLEVLSEWQVSIRSSERFMLRTFPWSCSPRTTHANSPRR